MAPRLNVFLSFYPKCFYLLVETVLNPITTHLRWPRVLPLEEEHGAIFQNDFPDASGAFLSPSFPRKVRVKRISQVGRRKNQLNESTSFRMLANGTKMGEFSLGKAEHVMAHRSPLKIGQRQSGAHCAIDNKSRDKREPGIGFGRFQFHQIPPSSLTPCIFVKVSAFEIINLSIFLPSSF